jgi:hypothetical protein
MRIIPERTLADRGAELVNARENLPGKERAAKRERPNQPVLDYPLDDLDPGIEQQLAQAKATRINAESARQKICAEIMDASKRLYRSLVEEGEQALDRAKKLEAAAELNVLESQRELQRSQSIRQEADSYLHKVITRAEEQSQEMIQQSQTIMADAVAFRESLLLEIKQQAALELDQAQSSRLEVDAYRERVLAQTQRQANDTLDRARLAAEQEGSEIKQRINMEARKVLAQADLIKAAAEEQLEAQRLYADAANLQAESREFLDQARTMVRQESPLAGLIFKNQSSVDSFLGHQTSDQRLPAAEEKPVSYRAKSVSAGDSEDSFRYDRPPQAESGTAWIKDSVDLTSAESAVFDGPEPTEPTDLAKQPPESLPSKPDPGSLLPANELVLGLESNQLCRAYPFSTISQQRIINDEMGELEILVTFGPPSELGMLFNRNLDGRSLMFETVAKLEPGVATMRDRETGSIWEALTGRAISGPLAGSELERLTWEYSFWFSWSQVHPTSDVYTGVYNQADPEE